MSVKNKLKCESNHDLMHLTVYCMVIALGAISCINADTLARVNLYPDTKLRENLHPDKISQENFDENTISRKNFDAKTISRENLHSETLARENIHPGTNPRQNLANATAYASRARSGDFTVHVQQIPLSRGKHKRGMLVAYQYAQRPSYPPPYLFVKPKRVTRRRRRHKRSSWKTNRDFQNVSRYPTNRRLFRMVNKLGYYLRVRSDGIIDGTKRPFDPSTLLLFESHGASIIRIKGVSSGRYITINSHNEIPTAKHSPHFHNSLFGLTVEENDWNTFAWYKYYSQVKFDIFLGITNRGEVKEPWKATPGQYATQFLTLPYK